MEARQAVIVGGAALAAFVVGRLTVAGGDRGDDVTRHAVVSDAAVPGALTASLARIESRLDALSLANAPASLERVPIEDVTPANAAELDEWRALTNELRTAIEAINARSRNVAVTSFEAAPSNASWREVLASAPPFDQRELQRLLDELGILRDENFVYPLELTFMTQAEIVSRLGLPTRPQESSNPSRQFVYECHLPDAKDPTYFIKSVEFTFNGMFVHNIFADFDSVDGR